MARPARTEPFKLIQLKVQPHIHDMLRQLAVINNTTMSLLIEEMVADRYRNTDLTLKPVEVPEAGWVAVPREPADLKINERFAIVDPEPAPEPAPAPKSRRSKPATFSPELFPATDIPDI